jgi:hypothetical protein
MYPRTKKQSNKKTTVHIFNGQFWYKFRLEIAKVRKYSKLVH